MKNFELASKGLIAASTQLILAYMWALSAWPKLTSTSYAENFAKRFENTFFVHLPGGITPSVYWLGFVELVGFLIACVALFKLEFIKGSYSWSKLSAAFSVFIFAQLGFGLRVLGDHPGFANIMMYMAAMLVMYHFYDRQERSKG